MKMIEPMDEPLKTDDLLVSHKTPIGTKSAPFNGRNLRISLRQWRMFHAVIDFDGFTGAANNLHISQSSISYTLAKMKEQLGVSLLTVKGRKAQITEEGKILLERSRDLVRNALELEELAENLHQGWGPEIRMAMDPSFPPTLLMLALRKFSFFPQNIRLSVKDATLDQAKKALQENTVDLAISTQVILGFAAKELIEIEHIAVAHPDNPFFTLGREITIDDLETQFQIAISSSNDYVTADVNYCFPKYSRLWNVSSLDRAIGALRHGLGYAWLPKYQAQRWLEKNQIRVLPLTNGCSHKTTLYIIFGRSIAADSNAKKFADILKSCSERQC